jgi:predicted nucleotidyltransferase
MTRNSIVEKIPEIRIFTNTVEHYARELSVVLVGSAARNAQTENSDIDLLVISASPLSNLYAPPRVHLVHSTFDDFIKQLQSGEDFEAWSVRFGIVIHDNGLWSEILSRPEAKTWPSWKKKVMHGARRLFLAKGLIMTGDLEAATEEMLYTTGHIARGLLLKADVFPLSRPELEEQTRAIGYPHLANIHKELRTNQTNNLRFLQRCQTYSKKLLVHLSAEDYKMCALEFQKRKRLKKQFRPKNGTSHSV